MLQNILEFPPSDEILAPIDHLFVNKTMLKNFALHEALSLGPSRSFH